MKGAKHHARRYRKTLAFLQEQLPAPAVILDLGVRNAFSEIMEAHGYTVYNTTGEDLDLDPDQVSHFEVDAVTAFEICEHLVSPLPVLSKLKGAKLIASIPLQLWFAKAYKSPIDPWDRHYHEFEDWQFDWLLEKAGWHIEKRLKWTSPVKKVGFRPLLRLFVPRYYAVSAVRKKIEN